jgi:hypothetical protein
MEGELKAARHSLLQRRIDQIVADFRRDWKWPQAPMPAEEQQEALPIEEPKPSNVEKSRL